MNVKGPSSLRDKPSRQRTIDSRGMAYRPWGGAQAARALARLSRHVACVGIHAPRASFDGLQARLTHAFPFVAILLCWQFLSHQRPARGTPCRALYYPVGPDSVTLSVQGGSGTSPAASRRWLSPTWNVTALSPAICAFASADETTPAQPPLPRFFSARKQQRASRCASSRWALGRTAAATPGAASCTPTPPGSVSPSWWRPACLRAA